MIAIGNINASKVYLGSEEISKIYLGNTQIWGGSSPTPVPPYDAQVEYLEANGSQWLSTGITYQNGIRVTCEAQYTGDYNKTQIILAPSALAGLWVGNVNNKKWGMRTTSGYTYGDSSVKTKVSVEYGSNTRKLYINDVLKDTYSKDTTSTDPIAVLNSYDGTFCSKAKLWWIQITDSNNQLLFDGIPVRAGQVGYLYDRVSGQLFGNSGTGSFVLGNDVTT